MPGLTARNGCKPLINWEQEGLLDRLHQLWDDHSVSTQQVGVILTREFEQDISKNAALGKAHRSGFTPRILTQPRPGPRRFVFDFTGPVCMFPIGHPGDEDSHFCGAGEVVPGKPYCKDHTKIAYIRLKTPEEREEERRRKLLHLKDAAD